MLLALSHYQTVPRWSNQCPKETVKLLDNSILIALYFQVDIGEAVLELILCSIALFTRCSDHFTMTKISK